MPVHPTAGRFISGAMASHCVRPLQERVATPGERIRGGFCFMFFCFWSVLGIFFAFPVGPVGGRGGSDRCGDGIFVCGRGAAHAFLQFPAVFGCIGGRVGRLSAGDF